MKTVRSKIDPFATECLANPYPFYEELREAGPVVWLKRYDIWAMARYEEVQAFLMDWETFCSSAGSGSVISGRGRRGAPQASSSRPIHPCIPAPEWS